jgi:hypothetical protein
MSSASAHVRLLVWCLDCRHRVDLDPADMAVRRGTETTIPE